MEIKMCHDTRDEFNSHVETCRIMEYHINFNSDYFYRRLAGHAFFVVYHYSGVENVVFLVNSPYSIIFSGIL